MGTRTDCNPHEAEAALLAVCLVSVVDGERAWVAARVGPPVLASARDLAVRANGVTPDVGPVSQDPGGVPGFAFFAGAPLGGTARAKLSATPLTRQTSDPRFIGGSAGSASIGSGAVFRTAWGGSAT